MNLRHCMVSIILVVSCTTVAPPSRPSGAAANLTVRSVSPGPGESLEAQSELRAEIDYSISGFSPAEEYYLAPLFDSAEGEGRTFNEFNRITDGWRLGEAEGHVSLRYSIDRELKSPQFARPPRVTFYVMVRTGPQTTRVIGRSNTWQLGSAGPVQH